MKAFPKNILSAFIVKTGNWECKESYAHPKLVMVRMTCWLANIPIMKFEMQEQLSYEIKSCQVEREVVCKCRKFLFELGEPVPYVL